MKLKVSIKKLCVNWQFIIRKNKLIIIWIKSKHNQKQK